MKIYYFHGIVFLLTFHSVSLLKDIFLKVNEGSETVTPYFRILAPQVICDRPKSGQVGDENSITIRMQTKAGQRLRYRIRILFDVLGGFRGQQHSLKVWRSVRLLEKRVNKIDYKRIMDKNQIEIQNEELTIGVYYSFQIIGIDSDGNESDEQLFSITFSDGSFKRSNPDGSIIPDDVTFLMLGAETTYANIEYPVEARVSFCSPNNDYYFKWNMTNIPNELQIHLNIPGNLLRFPPGTLVGGQQHIISAYVLRLNDSTVIIHSSLKLTVLKRGYSLQITPENLSIGISKPIQLKLILNNPDNFMIIPKYSWSCESIIDPQLCEQFNASSTELQDVEFLNKGRVSITGKVTLNDLELFQTSTITIDSNIIVVPYFEAIQMEIPAGQGFDVTTFLKDLVPNCRAEWEVINDPGFEYFDSSIIPGGLGNLVVYDLDENFLSDLIDYGNETLSREFLLSIPKAGDYENWTGLKGNVKYKFRLVTTCPAPIIECDINPDNQIVSYSDITIRTNEPPIGQPLDVNPKNGTALLTPFKFTTGTGIDESTDYPLKYSFKYIIDPGITIDINEYYENSITTTELPYSDQPIQTMYEICDSRQACSQIFGPNVTVYHPNITEASITKRLEDIQAAFNRLEYDEAFRLALPAAISLKNSNQNDLANFEAALINTIEIEIGKFTNPNRTISDRSQFLRLSRKFTDQLDESAQIILLIEKFAKEVERFKEENDTNIIVAYDVEDFDGDGGGKD